MVDICRHLHFVAAVKVHRLPDVATGHADVRVQCAECGHPFTFVGVDTIDGISRDGPTASVDGQELSIPIRPAILPAKTLT